MEVEWGRGGKVAPTARSVRIVHAAMAGGVIMFGLIAHFVMAPHANPSGNLAPMVPMILAGALAVCALSFLLSKRVPRTLDGESADAFWVRAAVPAQITWAALEGAALLSVVIHSRTASTAAIAVAAVAVVILVVLKPGYFEGR